ncbi:FMN-dependent NADH-azoreductase [Brevibacillus massiliensis]|jgi:FMN-dependent NADH-azoreductase|uniref:FMN-dependent NADH-azoreductase n=1 Tax=Brevibacillus massiliensis TaxID=1118054 RepID=UPI0002E64830|nr:FMN-dependent NADH-azoreductase [Brevibacillus massiliensis]
MAKVLYITANPKPTEQSYGLTVGQAFLEEYRRLNPSDEITELDLFKAEVPQIDADVLSAWGKLQQGKSWDELTPVEQAKVGRMNELLEQFMSADKYVFVTPMWNFGFPAVVKAYIDTLCVAGKTFRYTENGPIGLLTNRKAVHIQARGGIYSEGPAREIEFGDRFLRTALGFVGITDVESVYVEGMNQMPQEAEAIKEKAIQQAREAAARFAKEPVRA